MQNLEISDDETGNRTPHSGQSTPVNYSPISKFGSPIDDSGTVLEVSFDDSIGFDKIQFISIVTAKNFQDFNNVL